MILDIYTDASVNLQTKEAGFAYWIACYQFEVQRAGHASNIRSSGDGETFCVNHALLWLLKKDLVPIEKINIYTDSTEVIHKLTANRPAAFFNMIEVTLKNGMRPRQVHDLFKLHHVKAHTKGTDNKSYRNRWCDMMAKDHRNRRDGFFATIFDYTDILV